jgi:UTP--glucose-1-phosphate uridylyltransferase
MAITKAIIPVAGYGVRRLPITKSIEKCMLPIGNRPLVDYVVSDCILAGITEIYFVVSSDNSQLESYYSDNNQLNQYLIKNNKTDYLPLIKPPSVQFHYIVQSVDGKLDLRKTSHPSGNTSTSSKDIFSGEGDPVGSSTTEKWPMDGDSVSESAGILRKSSKYGTAIPVSLVMPMIDEGESVVVLMGDDFVYNSDGSSEVARLLNATPNGGNAILGVNVEPDEVSRYGVLQIDDDNNYISIVERPTIEDAPSTLINISKYVFNYDLLKTIENYSNTTVEGEYYITEAINQYVNAGGKVKVVPAVGEYLDGGSLEGWLRANNVVVEKNRL